MFGKMKELMEMKKQADKIKKELDAVDVEVQEVRGITIAINGSQRFRSVSIDDSLLTVSNKAKLEKDLLRSLNAAIQKSQHVAAKKMQAVMPGLGGGL